MLLSAGLSYELFKNLKIIGGIKSFTGKGNEVGSQRDEYDQVVGYELLDFDSKEDILMLGPVSYTHLTLPTILLV